MPSSLSADALQPYDILKLEEGGMAPPYKVDTQYHLLKLVKRENEKAQTLRNLFYRDEKHNDLCFQESRQPAPDQQHYFEQLEIHPDGRVTGKRYCFALNDTRPQYTEYGSITVRSQSLNGIDAGH